MSPSDGFTIKDSGERKAFDSGMVRDTSEGKLDWLNLLFGPMARRWAQHMTNGREKYPDPELGVPNWTLAEGPEEELRFKQSAFRHFMQWINGDRDEDHAAAVLFNINGAEYVREKMEPKLDAADVTWTAASSLIAQPSVEELFPDLYDGKTDYVAGLLCEQTSPDHWYCERPRGHEGLHAARSAYRTTPWE